MVLAWGVLGLIAWILVAFWPARIASKKGHSFLLWFAISLFFWFITLFITVLVLEDKTKTPQDIADDEAVREIMDNEIKRG